MTETRDHSVERMKGLKEQFLKFKNPHDAEFLSEEFFKDYLWHWMTRVRLLSKYGEGLMYKEGDVGKHWDELVKVIPYFQDLGHNISFDKSFIRYSTQKPFKWPWQR